MNVRAIVIGVVIGLVFGAGIASLAWTLVTDSGGNEDVAAVCGVVERTALPDENASGEDLQRWGISSVMPSVAKDNPEYQPLADALEKAVRTMQQGDFDGARKEIDKVKSLCSDA